MAKKPQHGKAPKATSQRLSTPLGAGQHSQQQQPSGPSPFQAPQTVTCAEDIVLLSMLSKVPGQVREFSPQPITESQEVRENRSLSFEQESQLATTFAFLSGITDDSEHVTAVCIEEVPSTQGCKILVAINKATPGSRDNLLQRIEEGFEGILRNLARISSG